MKARYSLPVLALAFLLTGLSCQAEEMRLWTSRADGRQFKGTLVKVDGDLISIRRESDQVVFQVNRSNLIPEDGEWIEKNAPGKTPEASPAEDLSDLLSGIPAATGTPAISVLLVMDGETRGFGVAGLRKAGGTQQAGLDDKWHLGSCTKSMTATLAATLVEEGALTWETTVSDVLGKELKMRDAYGAVTLGQLLAHRGGIPGKVLDAVYASVEIGARTEDLSDRERMNQRARYAEAVLNIEPSRPPDSGYEYSNSGYVVAGAMMEQVTGKSWETLMEERIFKPLGMTSSGFGNAARGNKGSDPAHPWPHQNGKTPVAPGPGDDNPWVLGPAGTVHGSMKDVARYLAMHATLETGPVLKKKETFAYLHTALPDNGTYARGWLVTATAWSQGPALAHDGSNTLNYCSLWVAPGRKAAIAAFSNCGEKGDESCRAAIELVVDRFLK